MPQLARPSVPSWPRGLGREVIPVSASFTWDQTYNDRVIRVDSAATITLPSDAPVGSNSTIFQYGTGTATVAAGTLANLIAPAGQTTTNSRYDTLEVRVDKLGFWTVRGGAAGKSSSPTAGIGYVTGAGTAGTQASSRTTTIVSAGICGSLTLVSAAGSTTAATCTVTCTPCLATDVVNISQKSGTDKYRVAVTAVADGSFEITFNTIAGTTVETPVFNYAIVRAVAA